MLYLFDIADPKELNGSRHDVYHLARENALAGKPFPKTYLWCGVDDSLLEDSRRYDALLSELGVEHVYEESEGDHSWQWWDLHIRSAMKYLLGK